MKGLYPQPLSVVGDCSRAMISAAPGHILIGADFSAIESRVLAWVAGEAWKLDSYRRFDATNDPADEPYCETACRIFRVPSGSYTKDSPERAVGKVCDLAFGYMGGLNAWRKFEPDRFTDDEVKKFCSSGGPPIRPSASCGTTSIAPPWSPFVNVDELSVADRSPSRAPAGSCC